MKQKDLEEIIESKNNQHRALLAKKEFLTNFTHKGISLSYSDTLTRKEQIFLVELGLDRLTKDIIYYKNLYDEGQNDAG